MKKEAEASDMVGQGDFRWVVTAGARRCGVAKRSIACETRLVVPETRNCLLATDDRRYHQEHNVKGPLES